MQVILHMYLKSEAVLFCAFHQFQEQIKHVGEVF